MLGVGSRVKVKFKDGVWYKGSVSTLEKGKIGEVVKVGISYDDSDEEEINWPDKDIVLIGSSEGEKARKKKAKRNDIQVNKSDENGKENTRRRTNEVGSKSGEIEVNGERLFIVVKVNVDIIRIELMFLGDIKRMSMISMLDISFVMRIVVILKLSWRVMLKHIKRLSTISVLHTISVVRTDVIIRRRMWVVLKS